MLSKDTLRLIEDNVRQILDPLGFELIEFKGISSSNSMILRFLIDRTKGGITLNECAQLNNDIGQLLDEKNIVSEKYTLEVFSPGLDRPLVDSRDFRRTLEKRIHIFLKEEQYGKLELEGKLVKLDIDGIFIINDKDKELFISFSKINRAKQVIL
ncbi:MAG: hypothetical protein ISS47_00085 [Candidatus Omnitrophica bacterium]|nr:hypothetical protein [Candidatus Omnitrophota bacterium]